MTRGICSGVDQVMSNSLDSFGNIIVIFVFQKDVQQATQEIRDAISGIRNRLPPEMEEPILRRFDPADIPIMQMTLSSPALSNADLTRMVDPGITKELRSIQGVAQVNVIGGIGDDSILGNAAANSLLGGSGNDTVDHHILKFTRDGKHLLTIGEYEKTNGSADTHLLGGPSGIWVDPKTNELYVADGYGNHRVIVFDADTLKYKRHWGAYGNKPSDADLGPYDPAAPPAQQFRNPVHCAEKSVDNLVYVCDRVNDRLQVFTTEGKFVKEAFFARDTLASGSVWDIVFSKDPDQKFIFMADGQNERVRIIVRETSHADEPPAGAREIFRDERFIAWLLPAD